MPVAPQWRPRRRQNAFGRRARYLNPAAARRQTRQRRTAYDTHQSDWMTIAAALRTRALFSAAVVRSRIQPLRHRTAQLMHVSDRGLCDLAGHEGIVPYPYFDSVGVLTVGIGHTASAGPPDPKTLPRGEAIPLEDVLAIFRRDVARFEARVNDAVKVPLAQHEFDALVSFDFNTGGIYRAKLTKHLNRGDRKAAADAFMGWKRPAEIIPRRRNEQALFRGGTYGDGHATVYRASASGNVLWGTGKRVLVLDILRAMPRQPDDPGSSPSAAPSRAIGKAIAALIAAAVAAFLAWMIGG